MANPSSVSHINSPSSPRRAHVSDSRSLAKYHAEMEQKAEEKRSRQREAGRAYDNRKRAERNEKSRLYQQRKRAQFQTLPANEQEAIHAKKNEYAAVSRQNNRVTLRNKAQLRRFAQNPNLLPRTRKLNRPQEYSDEQRLMHEQRNQWKTQKRLRVRAYLAAQEDDDGNVGARGVEEGDEEDETDDEMDDETDVEDL